MNPHNKDEFTAAWEALDKPEEIRKRLADDEIKELKKDSEGRWYWVENGEVKGS